MTRQFGVCVFLNQTVKLRHWVTMWDDYSTVFEIKQGIPV